MPTARERSRKATKKAQADTDALLAAAAAGTLVAGGQPGPAAAAAATAAATTPSALNIVTRALEAMAAAPDDLSWVPAAVRSSVRRGTTQADLEAAVAAEQGREAEFLRRMLARLETTIPEALASADPGAALGAVLEREKAFLKMHKEAVATRVAAAASRAQLKRISPDGAFWVMSKTVKEHTPDCVAMAAVGWWPWDILDRLFPPMHPGCRCDLLTHKEAQDAGLIGPNLPDTGDAATRAQLIIDAYGLLQEGVSLESLEPSELDVPHEQAVLTESYLSLLGSDPDPLDIEEVFWNRRYGEGTIWGGRFMPKRGGFAPRISLGDVLGRIMGADAPKLTQRGGQRSPATATHPPQAPAANVPSLSLAGQLEVPGSVSVAGGSRGHRGRPPENFGQLAATVIDKSKALAAEHGSVSNLRSVTVNPERDDTEGFRTWAGEVEIGPHAQLSIERAHQILSEQGRLDDFTSAAVYNAYRTTAHEALGHSVNPQNPESYIGDEAQRNLEEAITEEMAHLHAVDLLKSQGHWDVLRWAARHGDDYQVRGTYLPQRQALAQVLDDANVGLEDREALLTQMAYGMDPDKRIDLLGALHPGGAAAVRDAMSGYTDDDAIAPGASVLKPANYVDHRQQIRPGATIRILGREGEPQEGKVRDTERGSDGRWYSEVAVTDAEGRERLRYPDPDDVEFVKDAPHRQLKGDKVTGKIREGDKVEIVERNGNVLTGELRDLETDDALGWRASVITGPKTVLVRPSSITEIRKAGQESPPASHEGDAPGDSPSADTPGGVSDAQNASKGISTTPVPLEDAEGPREFDARRYQDPRRSLIRKLRAAPPGESVTAADGTKFTRGHHQESVLVKRPDGTQKRYPTVNRMANAETDALVARHRPAKGKKGQASPAPSGQASPATRDAHAAGLEAYRADRTSGLADENYVPDITDLSTPQASAAQAFEDASGYDDLQAIKRDPDGFDEHFRTKYSGDTGYTFTADGDEMVFGEGGHADATLEEGMAEKVRLSKWLDDAIAQHGTEASGPDGLVRITGMDHIDPAALEALGNGEVVDLHEPGYLAATGRVDVAKSIAETTAKGDAAIWTIDPAGTKALNMSEQNGMANDIDEWLFPAGTGFKVKRAGEKEGLPHYEVTLTGAAGQASPAPKPHAPDGDAPASVKAMQDGEKSTGPGLADDVDARPGLPDGFVRTSVTVGAGPLEGEVHKTEDVAEAARLLAEGKRVDLQQPHQVSTLLTELTSYLTRAEAGEIDEPTFDLCKVTLKGTNLFCADTKGVERIKMPQLKGIPLPGGRADRELKKSKKGKVDLAALFREHLESKGIKIEDHRVKASHLRASQRQLDAKKVILKKEQLLGGKKGLKKAAGKKPIDDLDPIFVSHDDYIVDGHHRWATAIAIDVGDGKLDDVDMDTMRVDMDIIELLDEANKFADDWGITPGGVGPGSGQASPALKGKAVEDMLDANRPELGARQQNAAELYIVDSEPFQGDYDPNEMLYDPSTDREYKLGPQVAMLKKAMKPLPESVTVYRGGADDGKLRGPFVSTTTDRKAAAGFGDINEVTVPAGTKALWLGWLGGEKELLVDRESLEAKGGQASPASHRTSPEAAKAIIAKGFDPTRSLDGRLGPGVYFAQGEYLDTGGAETKGDTAIHADVELKNPAPREVIGEVRMEAQAAAGPHPDYTHEGVGTREDWHARYVTAFLDGMKKRGHDGAETDYGETVVYDPSVISGAKVALGGQASPAQHGTNADAAESILRDGFDMDKSAPDGEFGPGIYFVQGNLVGTGMTGMFGGQALHADVELKNPATPDETNLVRQAARDAVKAASPDLTTREYAEAVKAEFLRRMAEEGHDGARSPDGGVIAVYDLSVISDVKVADDAEPAERRGEGDPGDYVPEVDDAVKSGQASPAVITPATSGFVDKLVAEVDGKPAGELQYQVITRPGEGTHSDIYIDEINVDEAYRRKGIASQLMRELEAGPAKGKVIDHGYRLAGGVKWAQGYYGHQHRYTRDGQPVGDEIADSLWARQDPEGRALLGKTETGAAALERFDKIAENARLADTLPHADAVVGKDAGREAAATVAGQASPAPKLPGMKSFLDKMTKDWKESGSKGKPERTPEVERSEQEAPPEPVQGIPDYSDQTEALTDEKAAGGSNGARFARDADGKRWLVKRYFGDQDRVATELLANAVYRELGVAVPNAGIHSIDNPDFSGIPDADIEEPPLPEPKNHKQLSTGMVVLEPDGRMWLFEPLNHYGGYKHTFSKGRLEDGLTPQQNARKELWEEMGMRAEPVAYLGDYEGTTTTTRLYVARRTSEPEDPPGGETEPDGVKLVTPDEAAQMLNTKRDADEILPDILAGDWPDTDAPDQPPAEGKPLAALTYPTIDGNLRRWKEPDPDLAEGFVADALLANYDVIGLGQDNVLWNNDKPIRLDQGGTFEYRARGKDKDYGPVPVELWSMRKGSGQANGTMAITDAGIRAQASDAELRLTPERIDALIDAAPFDNDAMRERVRENLKARVAWLGRFSRGEEEAPEPLADPAEIAAAFIHRDDNLDIYPEEDAALEHYLANQGTVDTHLRSGAPKAEADDDTAKAIRALDALLKDKVSRVDDEFYAYVVLPDPELAKGGDKLKGKWLTEKTYMNLDPNFEPTPGVAAIRVLVPDGAHALMPDALDSLEDPTPGRVILPRRSRIRINGVRDLDGAAIIDAELG